MFPQLTTVRSASTSAAISGLTSKTAGSSGGGVGGTPTARSNSLSTCCGRTIRRPRLCGSRCRSLRLNSRGDFSRYGSFNVAHGLVRRRCHRIYRWRRTPRNACIRSRTTLSNAVGDRTSSGTISGRNEMRLPVPDASLGERRFTGTTMRSRRFLNRRSAIERLPARAGHRGESAARSYPHPASGHSTGGAAPRWTARRRSAAKRLHLPGNHKIKAPLRLDYNAPLPPSVTPLWRTLQRAASTLLSTSGNLPAQAVTGTGRRARRFLGAPAGLASAGCAVAA